MLIINASSVIKIIQDAWFAQMRIIVKFVKMDSLKTLENVKLVVNCIMDVLLVIQQQYVLFVKICSILTSIITANFVKFLFQVVQVVLMILIVLHAYLAII